MLGIGDLVKDAVGPLFKGILGLIPDKNARAQASEIFDGQMLAALTGLVAGQLRINEQEAKHGSIFVAGWRPAIGWICGGGLAWNFILQPLIMWVAFIFGADLSGAPTLDVGPLMVLLGGMLGLGGLRTYEKVLGVSRKEIKK